MGSAIYPDVLPPGTGCGTVMGSRREFTNDYYVEDIYDWKLGNHYEYSVAEYKWTLTPNGGWRCGCVKAILQCVIEKYEHGTLKSTETERRDRFYPAGKNKTTATILPIEDGGSGYAALNYTEKVTPCYRNLIDLKFYPIDEGTYTLYTYTVVDVDACFVETGKVLITAFADPAKGANYVQVAGAYNYYRATPGESVRLFVDPMGSEGWAFKNWDDGVEGGWSSTDVASYITATSSDATYYARMAYRSIRITVLKSPGNAHGEVYGDGMYYPGEKVLIGAYARSGSGWKFRYWDDGTTSSPRKFYASEDATFTAIFDRVDPIAIGFYLGSYWLYSSPYTATATCSEGSLTWNGNDPSCCPRTDYINKWQGTAVRLSVSLDDNIPPCLEYTFNGWYYQNGSKISSEETFTHNGGGIVCPVYDVKVKISVVPSRSLKYTYPTWDEPQRETLSDISSVGVPSVKLGTGDTVQMTAVSDHYEFDVTWRQPELKGRTPAEGFNDLTGVLVKIESVKNSENDITIGAYQVVSSDFSVSSNEDGKIYKLGISTLDEYRTTGVVFSDSYTMFYAKKVKDGVTSSRATIYCDFSLGPFVRMTVLASQGRNVDNAIVQVGNDGSSGISYSLDDDVKGKIYSAEIGFIPSFKSGDKYAFKFPYSAFEGGRAQLCYLNGTTSDSLYIKCFVNGSLLKTKRGSGTSLFIGLTSSGSGSVDLKTLSESDFVDMILHVGTFWPLRNASGSILHNGSGAIMSDS